MSTRDKEIGLIENLDLTLIPFIGQDKGTSLMVLKWSSVFLTNSTCPSVCLSVHCCSMLCRLVGLIGSSFMAGVHTSHLLDVRSGPVQQYIGEIASQHRHKDYIQQTLTIRMP